jgi:hypothetical protein
MASPPKYPYLDGDGNPLGLLTAEEAVHLLNLPPRPSVFQTYNDSSSYPPEGSTFHASILPSYPSLDLLVSSWNTHTDMISSERGTSLQSASRYNATLHEENLWPRTAEYGKDSHHFMSIIRQSYDYGMYPDPVGNVTAGISSDLIIGASQFEVDASQTLSSSLAPDNGDHNERSTGKIAVSDCMTTPLRLGRPDPWYDIKSSEWTSKNQLDIKDGGLHEAVLVAMTRKDKQFTYKGKVGFWFRSESCGRLLLRSDGSQRTTCRNCWKLRLRKGKRPTTLAAQRPPGPRLQTPSILRIPEWEYDGSDDIFQEDKLNLLGENQ